jgi:hypothetical protein
VRVGGARPPLLITFTITSKIAVYAPAEWADTLTLFHLYENMYSVPETSAYWSEPEFLNILRSPRIDSKEPILPGYVAWRAGTTTLFLIGSIGCLKIPAPVYTLNEWSLSDNMSLDMRSRDDMSLCDGPHARWRFLISDIYQRIGQSSSSAQLYMNFNFPCMVNCKIDDFWWEFRGGRLIPTTYCTVRQRFANTNFNRARILNNLWGLGNE